MWPPIWQDGQHTTLESRFDGLAWHDPPVKDPNTNITIGSIRMWLTDQAYTGGHGAEFRRKGPLTNTKKDGVPIQDRCSKVCQKVHQPWAAPGQAPNLGGGCGILGGNPFGCPKGTDTRPPGSECGPPRFPSFGGSALQIDFPQAAHTEWQLGTIQVPSHVVTFLTLCCLTGGRLDIQGRPPWRLHLPPLQAAGRGQDRPH